MRFASKQYVQMTDLIAGKAVVRPSKAAKLRWVQQRKYRDFRHNLQVQFTSKIYKQNLQKIENLVNLDTGRDLAIELKRQSDRLLFRMPQDLYINLTRSISIFQIVKNTSQTPNSQLLSTSSPKFLELRDLSGLNKPNFVRVAVF
jgi:hypothetical protein